MSQIMSREGKPKSVRAQDEAWPWHMRFGHLHLIKEDGKRDVQINLFSMYFRKR
jgi:hypothetical protein